MSRADVIRKLGIEINFGGNAEESLENFAKQLYETKKGMQDFGSEADDTKRKMFGFGDAIKGLAASQGLRSMFNMGKEMVGLAADYEQTSVAFEVMIGSASEAKKVLKDLETFAVVTPFEPGPVNEAAKTLLGFQVSVEDLLPLMEKVGNVAAGTGKEYASLAKLVGKAHAINRVDNEMLQQVPILYGAMAKAMGVTEAQIFSMASAGQIGFGQLEAALTQLTGEGGAFFGMMDKQSQTSLGLWSTLQGNIDNVKKSIGQSIMVALKPLLEIVVAITDWISQSETALTVLKAALAVVVPLIGVMLVAALWSAVTAAWALVAPLGAVAVAGVAAMAPFLPLIAIVGVLILVVKDLWDLFHGEESFIGDIFTKIHEFFNWIVEAIGNIVKKVQELHAALTAKVMGFFRGIWNKIKGFFNDVIEGFKSLGGRILDFITAPFKKAYENIKNFFGSIYDFFAGEKEITVNGSISKNLPSNLPARANGGPVSAKRPYLVGERGPEIFVPHVSGNIIPNGGGLGSVTISPVINITGAGDPNAVAQAVMRKLEGILPSVRHSLGLEAV